MSPETSSSDSASRHYVAMKAATLSKDLSNIDSTTLEVEPNDYLIIQKDGVGSAVKTTFSKIKTELTPDATLTDKGVIAIASNNETVEGVVDNKAVVPSSLKVVSNNLQGQIASIENSKGVPNGIATLNRYGKIPSSQLDDNISSTDVFEVNSEAAMLALSTANQGDIALRTDINATFILANNNYADINSWEKFLTNKNDIGLSNVDNTSDLNKPISTATQNALNAVNKSIESLEIENDSNVKSVNDTTIAEGTNNVTLTTLRNPVTLENAIEVDNISSDNPTSNDATSVKIKAVGDTRGPNGGDISIEAVKGGYYSGAINISSTGNNSVIALNSDSKILLESENLVINSKPLGTAVSTSVSSASTNNTLATSKAVYDIVKTKQDTLIAGDNITIKNNVISSEGTTYKNATPTSDGLMSAKDKTKLDGIEPGAEVNTVTSVAGKTGAVVLNKNDIGLSNVDNTSDLNKPISTATQNALDLKADANVVVNSVNDQEVEEGTTNIVLNTLKNKVTLDNAIEVVNTSSNTLGTGDSTTIKLTADGDKAGIKGGSIDLTTTAKGYPYPTINLAATGIGQGGVINIKTNKTNSSGARFNDAFITVDSRSATRITMDASFVELNGSILGDAIATEINSDSPFDKIPTAKAVYNALDTKADKGDLYTKEQVDEDLALKADKSDTYTKTQVDESLNVKADKSNTYTKAQIDESLNTKADNDTVVKSINDAELDEGTNNVTLTTLRNPATLENAIEVDNINAGVGGSCDATSVKIKADGDTAGPSGGLIDLTATSKSSSPTVNIKAEGRFAGGIVTISAVNKSEPSEPSSFITINSDAALSNIHLKSKTLTLNGDLSGDAIDTAITSAASDKKVPTTLAVYNSLSNKADKSDTYSKSQIDTSLNTKADKSDTYTKEQVDSSLALKSDDSSVVKSINGIDIQEGTNDVTLNTLRNPVTLENAIEVKTLKSEDTGSEKATLIELKALGDTDGSKGGLINLLATSESNHPSITLNAVGNGKGGMIDISAYDLTKSQGIPNAFITVDASSDNAEIKIQSKILTLNGDLAGDAIVTDLISNHTDTKVPTSLATFNALGLKADKENTYTKTETDTLLNAKQNAEDDALDTTSKNIVGAINELRKGYFVTSTTSSSITLEEAKVGIAITSFNNHSGRVIINPNINNVGPVYLVEGSSYNNSNPIYPDPTNNTYIFNNLSNVYLFADNALDSAGIVIEIFG